LPGPTALHVAYVDEPRGAGPVVAGLVVHRIDVARVRIDGTLRTDASTIEVALTAALVT
jgi:hypothetical protein